MPEVLLGDPSCPQKDPSCLRPPETRLCQVCSQKMFKYTCPRCEVVYCSAPCYKVHSATCTEAFYHQQITDALTQRPMEDSAIVEALQRQHERNLNEDDHLEDLIPETRFKHLVALARQDRLRVEDLNEEELNAFGKALSRNEIQPQSGLGPSQFYTPWWLKAKLPERISIEHLCCASQTRPNWRNGLIILELCYAYTLISRSYAGDIKAEVEDCQLSNLWQVAKNFTSSDGIKDCDFVDALVDELLANTAQARILDQSLHVYRLCFSDVVCVFKNQESIEHVLHHLVKATRMLLRAAPASQTTKLWRTYLRKLRFIASFCSYHLNCTSYYTSVSLSISTRDQKRQVLTPVTTLRAFLLEELQLKCAQLETEKMTL